MRPDTSADRDASALRILADGLTVCRRTEATDTAHTVRLRPAPAGGGSWFAPYEVLPDPWTAHRLATPALYPRAGR